MLPIFPVFKPIEIKDQEDVEKITKNYPAYSNFNFVSLFCWDISGKRRISTLDGNLVIRSTSDITGKEFLTFMGDKNVVETIARLLKYSKKEGLNPALHLVPEEAVKHCSEHSSPINAKEDRDNFDYIYLVDDIASLRGDKYANLRKSVNKFAKMHENRFRVDFFDLNQVKCKKEMLNVWHQWNGMNERYSAREEIAFSRLLDNSNAFELTNSMVFVDDIPVAFSINHIANEETSISHFAKANYNFKGVLPFMDNQMALHLQKIGCKYMNFEEDMGMESLRFAKSKYRPTRFLKKYTIQGKQSIIKRCLSLRLFS